MIISLVGSLVLEPFLELHQGMAAMRYFVLPGAIHFSKAAVVSTPLSGGDWGAGLKDNSVLRLENHGGDGWGAGGAYVWPSYSKMGSQPVRRT